MAADVGRTIDQLISSKKVVVFSKSRCPYCTKAKQALASYKIDPANITIWEIENEPNCQEIQQYLKSLTGASSVPRVFIDGKFVGGGDDTVRLHQSGQLAKLLDGA